MKWTPNGFLKICGPLIFLVGLAGLFGFIGPSWRVTEADNLLHAITGFVMFIAGLTLPAATQKRVTILFGIVTLGVALYIITGVLFADIPFTEPANLIVHAVIATWALAVGARRSSGLIAQQAETKVL